MGKPIYFANFSNVHKHRTTETTSHNLLKDAKAVFDDENNSGYIIRQECSDKGLNTDRVKNTFVGFFGGFVPSAQEETVLKTLVDDYNTDKR